MTTWSDGADYATWAIMSQRYEDQLRADRKPADEAATLREKYRLRHARKAHLHSNLQPTAGTSPDGEKLPAIQVPKSPVIGIHAVTTIPPSEVTQSVAYFFYLVRKATGASEEALKSQEGARADWHNAEKIIVNKHEFGNKSIMRTAHRLRDEITKHAVSNYQHRMECQEQGNALGDYVKAERTVSDKFGLNKYGRILVLAA